MRRFQAPLLALSLAAVLAAMPAAFGHSLPRIAAGPGYSDWVARNRRQQPQKRPNSSGNWKKPHNGVQECARRVRQMRECKCIDPAAYNNFALHLA